mgnify:FL=1
MQTAVFFKYLHLLIYLLSAISSCLAGILLYTGLSTKEERLQSRIRFRKTLQESQKIIVEQSKKSKAEEWFEKADYPLGLNGLKYNFTYWGILAFLGCYYMIFPMLFGDKPSIVAAFAILLFAFLASPSFPYSLFCYIMRKYLEYLQAKKNAEVFMLYDLLINEIEMMVSTRINTYNILRDIKPYFDVLDKSLARLLSSWGSDEGPAVALERFQEELNSKEAEALIGVIKNLDNMSRETALQQLKGMQSMFTRSQIENFRIRRKLTTDLASLPVKATHFIIILNFVMVIVMMVVVILQNANTIQ